MYLLLACNTMSVLMWPALYRPSKFRFAVFDLDGICGTAVFSRYVDIATHIGSQGY